MVDGRVARATGQVTTFGAFFDSVIDRYSDVALFFGLLVYYARGNHFFYVVLVGIRDGHFRDGQLHAGTRRIADRQCKVGFHGASGAHGAGDYRRAVSTGAWRRSCG